MSLCQTWNFNIITEIQNWELSYVIIAPISGQITFTQYWSINQNIASGEPIFNIVPDEKGLLMGKALLPAERSGKVKIGQTVISLIMNLELLKE